MSTLYHIGRSGNDASMAILAENLRPYLEDLLESGGLPPGSYWIRESISDADPCEVGRDWGIIKVHTNGRWMVQTDAYIFGPGQEGKSQ